MGRSATQGRVDLATERLALVAMSGIGLCLRAKALMAPLLLPVGWAAMHSTAGISSRPPEHCSRTGQGMQSRGDGIPRVGLALARPIGFRRWEPRI